MSYKYILFDLDDTLLDYNKAEQFSLNKTFEEINHDDSEYMWKCFNSICDKLWKEFKLGEPLNEDVQENYHELYYEYSIRRFMVMKEYFNVTLHAELLSEKYLNSLAHCSFLVSDAFEVCRELSEKYKIFIITNGLSKVQKSRIDNSKIKPFILDVLVSENIGSIKPSKKFFDYVINKIGIPNLSEILIVGDSLATDIFGGNEYNIDTCWFNYKNKANESQIHPKFEVRRLIDLLNIV